MALNDVQLVHELDNKLTFLRKCQEVGLQVPDFVELSPTMPIDDLRTLRQYGKFDGGKHYFMKPLELQRAERMDLTPIPPDKEDFEQFVAEHLQHKDLSVPYILNEFIDGKEYCANLICKNGHIYMVQVCPSSPIQVNYVSMDHSGIKKWVEKFVKATQLSGLVCFDFIVDKNDQVFCIECNPRLHSAIVSFSQDKTVIFFKKFL